MHLTDPSTEVSIESLFFFVLLLLLFLSAGIVSTHTFLPALAHLSLFGSHS